VFTIRDGRIVAIRQYLGRAEALEAAGVDEPSADASRADGARLAVGILESGSGSG
jgi:hypothetical protein